MTTGETLRAEIEGLRSKMEASNDADERLLIADEIAEKRTALERSNVVLMKGRASKKDDSKKDDSKEKAPRQTRVTLPDAVRTLRSSKWDCLAYNERTTELVWLKKPPSQCDTAHPRFPAALVDADFTSIVSAFDSQDLALAYETAIKAAIRAGTHRSFDPVRDYLKGLVWDGEERIAWWLETYFGAGVDDSDELEAQAEERTWNQQIGKRWLISAVARVYDPGCQVDTILIAEGAQGIGKSSAFRALAVEDAWFACDLPDIKHKDAVHHVLGPWIIELDELDALSRKEATSVKSYVSRRTDRARLSYGKLSTNHPRRVVFCGTTNEDVYNSDATGGRRFWPFKVRRSIDVSAIERDRDQLWAEAVACYRAGELWHLEDEAMQRIAKAEQDKRFKPSPWLALIEDYVTGKSDVTVSDILENCLDMAKAHQSQRDMNEAVRCLQHIGWTQKQVRRDGKRVRVYEKR
jgi:predicted P-loop ATPase